MPETVLDHLLSSLRNAANISRAEQVRPAAVLWTDHEGQWQGVAERLRPLLPELLILGDYAPAERRGPAIWIKCMLARTLDEADWPDHAVPILYLPGVSRTDLRAIESCPRELQPLAELQYRGLFWSQLNGRDWTVNAFLSSSRGLLKLDISGDQATQAAMHRALDVVLDTPIADLQGRRLEASDFDALLSADPIRDLLAWMNDPETAAKDWQGARWDAFRSRCKADWTLDPQADGALVAAERFSEGQRQWDAVWERYRSGWRSFPTLIERLRQVALPLHRDLFTDLGRYPRANDEAEDQLRVDLLKLAGVHQTEAIAKLKALENAHGPRRLWLWAEMGQAPLARALEPLSQLVGLIAEPCGGQQLQDLATAYQQRFWQVDAAARRALACLGAGSRVKADTDAVSAALQAVYVPWLDQTNQHFQDLVRKDGYPGSTLVKEPVGTYQAGGECWLFVDGLRYDVAQDLASVLTADALEVKIDKAWAPVPSVTASGKVACSPLAHLAKGRSTDQDFVPSHATQDRPLDTDLLRKLLKEQGWQVLGGNETGDPTGRAWTEFGDLDHYGHEHGLRLAREIPSMLDSIREQIRFLIDAGWKQIRIVTDHGWLLVPGKMPKTALPKFLTATRWGRCAALTDSAQPTSLTLTWSWCPDVRIAMAPGINSFIAGQEYAHGGLSLQESLIPVLRVTRPRGVADEPSIEILEVKWTRLRCACVVRASSAGASGQDGLAAQGLTAPGQMPQALTPTQALRVDLRRKVNDPATSVAGGGKPLKGGKASLVVEDDELEGEAISLVVLDDQGRAVAKAATVIGGD
ncbi:BREX-1 system phosphatase PglZ type B [Lamprobacter modestohalophilus]|uniref:BREX-1 system phosphatase PglZ type B n=1 Tax=Lamprobacter modestohalophilus TaxID=1064514 RepID=UPI00190379B3|nr:BREX-1 system phosphatase PglZ type B [Lamprobacter modestohalophilus]